MHHDNVRMLGGFSNEISIPNRIEAGAKAGQIAIDGPSLLLRGASPESWVEIANFLGELFPFTTHKFTHTGQVGRIGPSLEQCLSAYSTALWSKDRNFFDVVNGVQQFVVPKSGIYQLNALGGGNNLAASARCQARIRLDVGDVLNVICGQAGTNIRAGNGATFVVSKNLGLLIAAGGGSGYQQGASPNTRYAKFDLANPGTGLGGIQASRYGTGGVLTHSAGGGAGFYGDGGIVSELVQKASSYANGSTGGLGYSNLASEAAQGGFGGGGGGTDNGGLGGGGGYTGGNAFAAAGGASAASGNGGTSFVLSGSRVTNTTAALVSSASPLDRGSLILTFLSE